MGKNISSKSLYLAWFSRYEHSKFKMAAIFGKTRGVKSTNNLGRSLADKKSTRH